MISVDAVELMVANADMLERGRTSNLGLDW